MKETSGVKFYGDLEFEPNKYEENKKEKDVNEMSRIFKKYVEEQWARDTGKNGGKIKLKKRRERCCEGMVRV